jgi:hypothetical protein
MDVIDRLPQTGEKDINLMAVGAKELANRGALPHEGVGVAGSVLTQRVRTHATVGSAPTVPCPGCGG